MTQNDRNDFVETWMCFGLIVMYLEKKDGLFWVEGAEDEKMKWFVYKIESAEILFNLNFDSRGRSPFVSFSAKHNCF